MTGQYRLVVMMLAGWGKKCSKDSRFVEAVSRYYEGTLKFWGQTL